MCIRDRFNRDIPKYHVNDGFFRILFTGRYSREKTHIVLLKAVNKSKYRNRIQLIFAGDGPQKSNLIKYSKRHLPIQPIMKFYSRTDLLKVLGLSLIHI